MATERQGSQLIGCILLFLCIMVSPDLVDADDKYRCPPGLKRDSYLRTHNGECYEFVNDEMSWSSAKYSCARRGGQLIVINRRDIQVFVEQSLVALAWPRNGLWIGATDQVEEMEWRWITGENVKSGFQNWDSSQPSCPFFDFMCHEDCACLRTDKGYKWHDYACGSSLFEYGFICQYGMRPPTVKPTTTSTMSTPAPTTTTKTSPSTNRTMPSTTPTTTTTTTTTSKPIIVTAIKTKPTTTTVVKDTTTHNLSIIIRPENIKSHMLMSKEEGLPTSSMVGIIVSFILVFVAGLIIGIFLCRRRYRKRYEESASVGFNNVLYTATPVRPSTRVKDTNIAIAGVCAGETTDEEFEDQRYVDMDQFAACGGKHVDLPTCKEVKLYSEATPTNDHLYEVVQEGEEPIDIEGGACGQNGPPPCPGVNMKFAPEFLKKDTNVSEAYTNNLYGYTK